MAKILNCSSAIPSFCSFAVFFIFFAFFFFFFFFSLCSSTATSPLGIYRRPFSAPAPEFYLQGLGRRVEEKMAVSLFTARRILSGPGSSPPRCTSKCGSCTPCKPVHVPVPPGTPVTAEYYPEAWRCKCGNKLYMP